MTRMTFLLVLILAASAALAQNSESAALINQQLDRQTKLQLSGTLPEAMRQITKQTFVPVEADPAVWELLPWGKETVVTATIENTTLRQGLEAITRKLGLTFVLKSEAIELQPLPALRRLAEKATVTELAVLNHLASTPLDLKAEKTTIRDLLAAVDQKLQATSQYSIENRSATSPDKVAQDAPLSIPRNATLMEALEAMTRQSSATWFPWEKTIVVLSKPDQVRRMLEKKISMRHDGTDVAEVLNDISARTGVPFRYEAGTLQSLAPQSRKITLVASNIPAIRALNEIRGATGLDFVPKDEDLYIWNSAAAPAPPRDRIVAMIQTEAGLTILVTESQLPEDIREYLQFQKKKSFDAMRKMMAEQGFKPTPATRPATRPDEPPGKDL